MSARLFVALDVAEADREALAGWAAQAVGEDRGLRLVEPGLVHLTLAFLGHRALDEIPAAVAVLEGLSVGHAPLQLTVAGALWLSPRRPHVLTVAVDDAGGRLAALRGRLWDGLEAELGVTREARVFRPHLTVARVRRGWIAPSRRLPEPPARALVPEALVLYRSWLGGGPARYEALARRPLT